jgi:hypothetical protein
MEALLLLLLLLIQHLLLLLLQSRLHPLVAAGWLGVWLHPAP